MIALNVRVSGLASVRRTVSPRRVAFAEREALKRTAANVQKLGIKLTSRHMGIRRTRIQKRGKRTTYGGSGKYGGVSITKRPTTRRLEAHISGLGRPHNIRRYKAKEIKAGARSSVQTGRMRQGKGSTIAVSHEAWGDRRVISPAWRLKNGAFVLPSGNSFRSVWGPGVAQAYGEPKIIRALKKRAGQSFKRHFKSRMRYAFSRRSHVVG